ncbi:hypothetical protein GALMADRAFT_95343 [Galerina marginata CBS 339.88]|uniref:Potassium channel domain-containing protein n=1 Tax=Galerina marginata (strain CBS 339.88) TaxID=685588 RepID=A0A067TF56_GALM3|nr:hypothetical protein GALMADRAFT_95343 [Galerina marginata CBS 339.88]
MNDPGHEDVIQDAETEIKGRAHRKPLEKNESICKDDGPSRSVTENSKEQLSHSGRRKSPKHERKSWKQQRAHGGPHHSYNNEDEEETSIYQPTLWWFTGTAFPLFAGTFGPIANLFSVCALAQTWQVSIGDGSRIRDPPWLLILNAISLFFALIANITLLFNFARRIPYSVAQPITISFWYLACILLVIPIALTHRSNFNPIKATYAQSYYYALISCVLYFTVSTILLISTLGSVLFHAYPPSFSTLTGPQRTLMLQTISFTLYLSLGAGVFSRIEGWGFTDGVYWADYTLLTIGLGTDFPLTTTLGRMLLIPYAAIGITLIGLVVSSVRGLLLERAKAKVVRRHLGKEREKWKENIQERRRIEALNEMESSTHDSETPLTPSQRWIRHRKEKDLMRLPRQFAKQVDAPFKKEEHMGPWHRAEFELMRFIEESTENVERYTALGISFLLVILLWVVGSLIFWSCEHKSQGWTYPESFYFTYTTLLTIGYGDFYPNSPAGKPFFVVWSLIAVPAMTVFISNIGDTVVKWVQIFTLWASRWTILPERRPESDQATKKKQRKHSRKKLIGEKQRPPELQLSHTSSKSPQGGTRNKSGLHQRTDRDSDAPERKKSDGSSIIEHDVERLGQAVEHFEEEEGRGGSLAARLAKEVSKLAKDMSAKPPKKYTWHEWAVWLDMLGEREYGSKREDPSGSMGDGTPSHAPILTDPSAEGYLELEVASHTQTGYHLGESETKAPHTEDWNWTWLGDHGPLFSKLTETEWIIEKLCFRLEEVLEDEIGEARASASKSQ